MYRAIVTFTLLIAAGITGVAAASRARAADSASPELIARGKYIVRQVGMCTDCHGFTLMGGRLAVIWRPDVAAAQRAPRIAGLAGYTEQQAMRLLEDGIARNGKSLRPPMPAYRLTARDASAVVAYLRSL
jgi:mono/diheme cytochrome c family protein